MKKSLKVLFALSLLFSFTLASCKSVDKPSEPEVVTSSSVSGSSSSSSASTSSSSSASTSTSSSSSEPTSSTSSSEPEEQVEYTAEKVCEDFNANLAAYGLAASWNEQYQEYGLAVNFGESDDESESNLGTGAHTLASFLPEYMIEEFEVYGDPTSEDYYDLFGDQSYYFYMSFVSPDELCESVVISYVYSGLLIAQISIADA